MARMEIPLSAVPFQTVNAVVNGQNYQIAVRQNGAFVYTSLLVDGETVTNNVQAVAHGRLIPFAQTIAQTMLYWLDTQGCDRPQYQGLGERWKIIFENDE